MAVANMYWHEPALPWSETENDRRFNKILLILLVAAVVLGIIVPILPVSKPEQKQLEQVTPRLAKLLIEKQKEKPPVPVVKPKVVKKQPTPEAAKKTAAARQKAQQSGLLALKSELASLQSAFDMSALSDSTPLSKADTSRTSSTRADVAESARKGSGGINTSSLSTRTGGAGLADRQTAAVKSNIATGGAGGLPESSRNARSEEEIALVFEQNKGAIFSLYNRALRSDPTLQGKVVLELTIDPSGQVAKCRIISSELNNPALEGKLVARVKLFKFAAKPVKSITVTYPIDFLPS